MATELRPETLSVGVQSARHAEILPAPVRRTQLVEALQPEARLLVLCSRTYVSRENREKIKQILTLDLDWQSVIEKAHQHCVAPLVYQTLDTVCRLGVPKDDFARLRRQVTQNTNLNLYRTAELVKLLRLLTDSGVAALPFKGPVLSAQVYGSLALREYGDLDILVRPKDVVKTKDLLLANGYHLVTSVRRRRPNHSFLPRNKDLIFENSSCAVRLELHWRLTGKYFHFPLDLDQLWNELERIELGGMQIPTLGAEASLLYLCMHGSRHGWERLIWICDVAELIRACPQINWDRVMERAALLGCERMVGLGLLLANELLDAELPPAIKLAIRKDSELRLLARRLAKSILGDDKGSSDIGYWYDIHLSVRERLRDRMRLRVHYLGRYARLAVTPNSRDEEILRLPASLSFLYYLLRPLRLLKRIGRAGAGADSLEARPKRVR